MASTRLTEADALYTDVSSAGLDISDKRNKLTLAQTLYSKALESSSTSEERASLCNSLGALYFLWSQVELETVPSWTAATTDTLATCNDHLRKAVRSYLTAKVEGVRAAKPEEWFETVEACMRSMVKWATEQSRMLGIADGMILQNLCDEFDDAMSKGNVKSEAGAVAYIELAQTLLDYYPKLESEARNGTVEEREGVAVLTFDGRVYRLRGEIKGLLNRAKAQLQDASSPDASELQDKLYFLQQQYTVRFLKKTRIVASKKLPPKSRCFCGLF